MATLGAPAITVPNALDLRAIQNAIQGIRQRIVAAEAAIGGVSTTSQTASQNSANIASLRNALNALTTRVTALEQAAVVDVETVTAATALNAYQAVVFSSLTAVSPIDPSTVASPLAAAGITLGVATSGQQVQVQRRGPLSVPGQNFEPGRAIYASSEGLTQFPNYDHLAIFIGAAIDATTMFIAPGVAALREPMFDYGYEDFLPPTYSLLKQLTDITGFPFQSGLDGTEEVAISVNDASFRTTTGAIAALAGTSGGTSPDDASLQIATRSYLPPTPYISPAAIVADSSSILAAQIFGG